MSAPAMPPPELQTAAPLLELRNVDAAYGPFRSLFDVSLSVRPGSVTALPSAIGTPPAGAGARPSAWSIPG